MQTCWEAAVLHSAPALDPHLQRIAGPAYRVFCIYSDQAAKKEARMPGAQRTLEAYSWGCTGGGRQD
jgi:hypothetical protein